MHAWSALAVIYNFICIHDPEELDETRAFDVTDVTNSAQIFIFALLSPKRAASALLRSQVSLPQSQRQVSQPRAALVLCHSRSQPSCCTTAAHSPRAMPLPLAASSQRSPSQHRTACPNAAGPCAASYVYIYLSL